MRRRHLSFPTALSGDTLQLNGHGYATWAVAIGWRGTGREAELSRPAPRVLAPPPPVPTCMGAGNRSHNCSGWALEGRLLDLLFTRLHHLARRLDAPPPPSPPPSSDEARLTRLEARVEELAGELARCRRGPPADGSGEGGGPDADGSAEAEAEPSEGWAEL